MPLSAHRARQALGLLLVPPKIRDDESLAAITFFDQLEIYPGLCWTQKIALTLELIIWNSRIQTYALQETARKNGDTICRNGEHHQLTLQKV